MRYFVLLLGLVATAATLPLDVRDAPGSTATPNITWVDVAGICRNHDSQGGGCKSPVLSGFDDPDDTLIEDMEYFRFSTANIEDSRVDDWYWAWALSRQNSTEWTENGEWNLFVMDFLHDANFQCDWAYPSCAPPSRVVLQKMYPTNRPLVRRIHFTLVRYQKAHDYVLAIDGAMTRAQHTVVGLIPQIVSTFTLQVNAAKALKCEQLHTLVYQVVQTGIMIAATIGGGFIVAGVNAVSQAVTDAERNLGQFTKTLVAGAELTAEQRMEQRQLQNVLDTAKHNLAKVSWVSPVVNKKPEVKFAWYNIPVNMIGPWGGIAYTDARKAMNQHYQSIGPGIAHGILCSAFEGDFQDRSAANRDELTYRISAMFNSDRKQRQLWFRDILRGNVSVPGQPSPTSIWFKSRAWAGPGSVSEEMTDITKLEETSTTAIVKALISDILINDFNYIKCGYKEDAPKHCAKAKNASKGQDISVFCPFPDTDPQFMCDSRRWYFSDHAPHDIPMVASHGKKIENFASGIYNFTQEMLLQESFKNYGLYGHSSHDDFSMWGRENSTSQGVGFRIPVCVTDKPHFFEALGYPAICGDWRSEETLPFIEAMHAGVDSTVYQYRRQGVPQSLYTEIIPKILADFSPLTRYLAFCDNGIRFPGPKEKTGPITNWKKIQQGRDSDCTLIRKGVAGVDTEEEANRWFCTNQAGHTIFKREKDHIDSPHLKVSLRNHAHKCKNWLKKHGHSAMD